MRPTVNSQAGRILALLETGGWWSTSDLLKAVPAITHSRIADLREKGYEIEHKTVGPGAQGSLYRITGFVLTAGVAMEPSPAVGGVPADGGVPGDDLPRSPSPGHEGASPQGVPSDQLALELPARLRDEAA